MNTLQSSFFSFPIVRQIIIGYFAAALVLGIQGFIFSIGYKYCGVWDELSWLTQASTSLVPAFAALAIGFQASFVEESMFRMFAINLFRKYGIPVALAVVLSAVIWGFGHTGYAIFPMWFRGVEVTCVGLIMGAFYMRYGLMCTITAHYLVDSFLFSLPFLLNPARVVNFYSALFVISLPVLMAIAALAFNRGQEERPTKLRFNAQQQFNYDLLLELVRGKKPEERENLKKDLQRHGWDMTIIKRVFGEKD